MDRLSIVSDESDGEDGEGDDAEIHRDSVCVCPCAGLLTCRVSKVIRTLC